MFALAGNIQNWFLKLFAVFFLNFFCWLLGLHIPTKLEICLAFGSSHPCKKILQNWKCCCLLGLHIPIKIQSYKLGNFVVFWVFTSIYIKLEKYRSNALIFGLKSGCTSQDLLPRILLFGQQVPKVWLSSWATGKPKASFVLNLNIPQNVHQTNHERDRQQSFKQDIAKYCKQHDFLIIDIINKIYYKQY